MRAKHIFYQRATLSLRKTLPTLQMVGIFPLQMILGIAFLPMVVLHGLRGQGARRKFPLLLLRGLATAVPNMEKESSNQLS